MSIDIATRTIIVRTEDPELEGKKIEAVIAIEHDTELEAGQLTVEIIFTKRDSQPLPAEQDLL